MDGSNHAASQLLKSGRSQPVEFTLGARYYAETPEGGPDWGLRFVVTFLFPKCRALQFCTMRDDDQNSTGSLALPEVEGI